MDQASALRLQQGPAADAGAGRSVADTLCTLAFEIWKARHDLPPDRDLSIAAAEAVPVSGDATAAAAPRRGAAPAAPPIPLPALDGRPDAWL